MSSDLTPEEERAEHEAEVSADRANRKVCFSKVLGLPEGRRVLELLVFEFGGLQEQAHASDSHQRSFNDGQRQVGIALDRELYAVDREGWARMHAERIQRLRDVRVDDRPNKTDD